MLLKTEKKCSRHPACYGEILMLKKRKGVPFFYCNKCSTQYMGAGIFTSKGSKALLADSRLFKAFELKNAIHHREDFVYVSYEELPAERPLCIKPGGNLFIRHVLFDPETVEDYFQKIKETEEGPFSIKGKTLYFHENHKMNSRQIEEWWEDIEIAGDLPENKFLAHLFWMSSNEWRKDPIIMGA